MLIRNYLLLLAIGLIWGSQFIFQEFALVSFSPVLIGTIRAIIGALTLAIICKTMGLKSSSSNQWLLYGLLGLLEVTIPLVLMPWGQQNLDSSIVAILIGTMPFYVLLFSPLLIKNATISKSDVISVIIGFTGLVILFYPSLFSQEHSIHLISSLAVVLAAVCFGVALLLLNRVKNEHALIVARNVFAMASVQLIVLSLITGSFTYQVITSQALLSMLYLGVFCSGLAYFLYMVSIRNAGSVFTSMTNYIVPAVGVIIGAVTLNESIHLNTWVALFVILAALLIDQLLSKKSLNTH